MTELRAELVVELKRFAAQAESQGDMPLAAVLNDLLSVLMVWQPNGVELMMMALLPFMQEWLSFVGRCADRAKLAGRDDVLDQEYITDGK